MILLRIYIFWKFKEFDCELTREIIKLIDREGDLVSRGRQPQSMEGKTISHIFLSNIDFLNIF